MATDINLIYCANGNSRYAKIATDAGFLYGAQLPGHVSQPLHFADQDWKNPDRDAYIKELGKHRPTMASVLDLERPSQIVEVLGWAEDAAQYVDIVMIIPKYFGAIGLLPREIGGATVRLGYSVPTKHGGTIVPFSEFVGWPVHLLGGSPQAQIRLTRYLNVGSIDGNMHLKMANQFCAFYDPYRKSKRGLWPTITDYDGEPWPEDGANYEAFRRSCVNIMDFWHSRHETKRDKSQLVLL